MEISVRYVRPPGGGLKPALCFRGRKYVRCIVNDERSIRVKEITLRAYDTASFPDDHGHPYSVEKFISHMERISCIKPITQASLKLIERARSGVDIADEEMPPEDPEQPDGSEAGQANPSPQAQAHPVSEVDRPAVSGPTLVAAIAAERKIEPVKLRRMLRAAGLHAPYTDRAAIEKALAA